MPNASLKLYDATDALLDVRVWLEEHSDEIIAASGELPPELAELLDLAEGQLEAKVERVALYVRELIATADAIDSEAKRLAARAKAARNTADGLKGYLKAQLERVGMTSVKGVLATVRIQKSRAPMTRWLGPALLDDVWGVPQYQRFMHRITTYRLNVDAVVQAKQAGEVLPEGIACEYHTHLRLA